MTTYNQSIGYNQSNVTYLGYFQLIDSLSETINLTEWVITQSSLNQIIQDTLNLTEELASITTDLDLFIEQITLSENVATNLWIYSFLNETLYLVESIETWIWNMLSDTIWTSENLSDKTMQNVLDSIMISESSNTKTQFYSSLQELLNLTEQIKGYINWIADIWTIRSSNTTPPITTDWTERNPISTDYTIRTPITTDWTERINPNEL